MQVSDLGKRLIKSYEGLRLKAYQDVKGVWTIGWGHTGPDVKRGLVISEALAESLFNRDIAAFSNRVSMLVKVPLEQNEFDAMVSLAYNIGYGGLAGSTLLRKLNAGDKLGAVMEFPRWSMSGKKRYLGLIRRRLVEALLFTKTRPAVTV